MIDVNKNQMVNDMTRGGKREGAGRPQSEPTKQVRIPFSMANVARELVDIYKDRLTEKLHDERWFTSAPSDEQKKVELTNIRVEFVEFGSKFITEAGRLRPCIAADAKHPNGEGVTVWVKI